MIYLDDADEGAGPPVLRGERHDGDGHDDPVGVAEQHDGRHQRHHLDALGERRRHGLHGAGHGSAGAGGGTDPVEARAAHGEDLPPAAPPDDPRSIAAEHAETAATDDDATPPAAAGAGAATVAAERQGRGPYAQPSRSPQTGRPGPRGSVPDRAHGGLHGHARPDRRHGWSSFDPTTPRRAWAKEKEKPSPTHGKHSSKQGLAGWLALPLSLSEEHGGGRRERRAASLAHGSAGGGSG